MFKSDIVDGLVEHFPAIIDLIIDEEKLNPETMEGLKCMCECLKVIL